MSYPFPNVRQRCLVCSRSGCARWKGYYVRSVICGELEFAGPIAIHVGHCKEEKRDFSYFPDFLFQGASYRAQRLRSLCKSSKRVQASGAALTAWSPRSRSMILP
jgi:hypothetical protein